LVFIVFENSLRKRKNAYSIYRPTINLQAAVTLGGAYDGGGASPVIYRVIRFVAVGGKWRCRLFVLMAEVTIS